MLMPSPRSRRLYHRGHSLARRDGPCPGRPPTSRKPSPGTSPQLGPRSFWSPLRLQNGTSEMYFVLSGGLHKITFPPALGLDGSTAGSPGPSEPHRSERVLLGHCDGGDSGSGPHGHSVPQAPSAGGHWHVGSPRILYTPGRRSERAHTAKESLRSLPSLVSVPLPASPQTSPGGTEPGRGARLAGGQGEHHRGPCSERPAPLL